MSFTAYRLTPAQFNTKVLKAIDRGLEVLGGEPVKRAFYYHIQKTVRIEREDIPSELKAFDEALADLFHEGAQILEIRIARELFEMLNLEFAENGGWTLSDYAMHAERCSVGRVRLASFFMNNFGLEFVWRRNPSSKYGIGA